MNIRYECYDARDDFHAQLKSRLAAQLTNGADGMDDEASGEDEDIAAEDSSFSNDASEGDLGTWTRRKMNQMNDVEVVLQEAGWYVDGASREGASSSAFCPERVFSPTKWKDIVDRERKALLNARINGVPNVSRLEDDMDLDIRPVNDAHVIPGSYLLGDFKVGDADIASHLERIRTLWGLNAEQARAFNIVAHHALSDSPEPLRMYLGGMGGTGKTRVIKALLQWFEERGESHRMVVLAPTGAAASIIRGSTYHSFLSVRTGEPRQSFQSASKALEDARLRMVGVEYIFIDEISMVSC
jgi:ATP-dependent DNA helicase PIF1